MSDLHPFATAIPATNLVNAAAIHQAISQRQLLRLQTAAQILSGWATGNDALWSEEMNTTMSKKELVNLAVDYADLLIQRIAETADQV